ncbi:MAG TPA: hypothetical protein VF723_15290 [Pyrinomonadaceae bacterium]
MSENIIDDDGAGESLTAEAFLDCAAQLAESIDDLEGSSEVFSLVAGGYAEAGLTDAAVGAAEMIDDPYLRDQTFVNIAARCVELKDADFAGEILELIEDENLHALAREQMAVKYAEAGELENALEVARSLSDSAPALGAIALACAGKGSFTRAVELARAIEYADLKAPVLCQLAARAEREGRKPEAAELLLESTVAAEGIELTQDRINCLVEIAALYQELGEEERAGQLLSLALGLCDEYEGAAYVGLGQTFARDSALGQIAASMAHLQRYDEADAIIERIEDAFQFASALVGVALEYQRAGHTEQALALLAQAAELGREEEVRGEQDMVVRDRLLAELANGYATAAHYEEALELAGTISSEERRHAALTEIAKLSVRAGNNGLPFQLAELFREPFAAARYWIQSSDAFVAAEQAELANRALAHALVSADGVSGPYRKALALMEIAPRLARTGQPERASEILFQALNSITLIDSHYHQARALISLAVKYGEAGREPGQREEQVLQEMIQE